MPKSTNDLKGSREAMQAMGKKNYVLKIGILQFGSIFSALSYLMSSVFTNVSNNAALFSSQGFTSYSITELLLGGLFYMIISGGIYGLLSWKMLGWMYNSNAVSR